MGEAKLRAGWGLGAAAVAAAFLTVVPLPAQSPAVISRTRSGRTFFPLVGLLLGLCAAAVYALLAALAGQPAAAVATMIVITVVTGGLHLDALADLADSLGAKDASQSLQIMKDPRLGTFGVAAIVLFLLAEYTCLVAAPIHREMLAIFLAVTLSRWAILVALVAQPYVRDQGLGVAMNAPSKWPDLALGTAFVVWLALLGWLTVLAAVAACLIGIALVTLLGWIRLRGATGDVYGAAIEIAELATLSVLVFRP